MTERFHQAIARMDAANAEDPNSTPTPGDARPKELRHAELVTEWVTRLRPDADEALLLAARGHHIRRWTVPRSSYPAGRTGYLRWRTFLHEVHADEVARILKAVGYDQSTVDRVRHIVRKDDLRSDPDVQTLEDALCLVFLGEQLEGYAPRMDETKLVEVLRKSWAKMSPRAHELALSLDLDPTAADLVRRALAE
jgi:hypothetical protein